MFYISSELIVLLCLFRYEALVPGNIEYAAKYQDKVYIFESEEKLLEFMR